MFAELTANPAFQRDGQVRAALDFL